MIPTLFKIFYVRSSIPNQTEEIIKANLMKWAANLIIASGFGVYMNAAADEKEFLKLYEIK